MIQSCQTEEDFQRLLDASQGRPVFLFKHSTRCPISAGARTRFVQFAEEFPEVECWEVLVLENRATSNYVASHTGVTHQSPQAILFKDGKAVWSASHHAITHQALVEALAAI